jgi:Rieske Fe-S protein
VTYGVSACAAGALGVPVVGYLFGARKAPIEWQDLGPVKDFPLNQTRKITFTNKISQPWDGMVAHTGVYVRYEGKTIEDMEHTRGHKFLILAVNCAHLGCPVEWFQESGLFMCPCHGGVYYANGERASGPPPRGMFPYIYRVMQKDGNDHLEIQSPHYPSLQDTLDGKE